MTYDPKRTEALNRYYEMTLLVDWLSLSDTAAPLISGKSPASIVREARDALFEHEATAKDKISFSRYEDDGSWICRGWRIVPVDSDGERGFKQTVWQIDRLINGKYEKFSTYNHAFLETAKTVVREQIARESSTSFG